MTIEQVLDRVHKIGIILKMINSKIASGARELEREEALLHMLEDYVWLTRESVEGLMHLHGKARRRRHEDTRLHN